MGKAGLSQLWCTHTSIESVCAACVWQALLRDALRAHSWLHAQAHTHTHAAQWGFKPPCAINHQLDFRTFSKEIVLVMVIGLCGSHFFQ